MIGSVASSPNARHALLVNSIILNSKCIKNADEHPQFILKNYGDVT